MLNYEQSKAGTRDGLRLIANGDFVFTDDNHCRYESASLQRAKAKALLEALDAQLSGPDAPTDVGRMLLEYNVYWKWRDSVTVWTDLFHPYVAAQLAKHSNESPSTSGN